MEIEDKTIEEFRKLYTEEFGEEISVTEARVMAKRLLTLYLALAKKPAQNEDKS